MSQVRSIKYVKNTLLLSTVIGLAATLTAACSQGPGIESNPQALGGIGEAPKADGSCNGALVVCNALCQVSCPVNANGDAAVSDGGGTADASIAQDARPQSDAQPLPDAGSDGGLAYGPLDARLAKNWHTNAVRIDGTLDLEAMSLEFDGSATATEYQQNPNGQPALRVTHRGNWLATLVPAPMREGTFEFTFTPVAGDGWASIRHYRFVVISTNFCAPRGHFTYLDAPIPPGFNGGHSVLSCSKGRPFSMRCAWEGYWDTDTGPCGQ
jgi:hypothetical protein